jgi:hypothetical protein
MVGWNMRSLALALIAVSLIGPAPAIAEVAIDHHAAIHEERLKIETVRRSIRDARCDKVSPSIYDERCVALGRELGERERRFNDLRRARDEAVGVTGVRAATPDPIQRLRATAKGPIVLEPMEVATEPVATVEEISAPQVTAPERPSQPARSAVRVVAPALLPPQGEAIDLRAPGRTLDR